MSEIMKKMYASVILWNADAKIFNTNISKFNQTVYSNNNMLL